MTGEVEYWLKLLPSLALTTVLALLALYFVVRASKSPRESPAIWGATASTSAIFGLSFLQTVGLLISIAPEVWVQASLRTIAVVGIIQFWWFYRKVIVVKKAQPKGNGA